MNYNQEIFKSNGIDLGSTTVKATSGLVAGNNFSVLLKDYRSYVQSYLPTGERAWWGEALNRNIEKLLSLVGQNYETLGVTGLSNSGLMVVNKKTGIPIVGFYDKPPLVYTPGQAASEKLLEAKVGPKVDVAYTMGKALAYAERYRQILDAVGCKRMSFEETGIEPMVCTMARLLTNKAFDQGPGFYSHEHKGITGSPNGVKSKDVIRVLTAFGFGRDQFTTCDTNVFKEDNLVVAGDFPTLLSYVKAMQDGKKIDKDIVGIETGSNMKVYTLADEKSKALPRHSDIGYGYRLLRNGAAVHSRIFMQYLLTDGTEDNKWFVRASAMAESARDSLLDNNVQYMYFPKVSDDESIGVLWDRKAGRQVKWEQVAKMDGNHKAIIAAATYAGVAAELRKMLEEIRDEKQINKIYLHDQFVSEENQPFKREILASMFGNGFNTYLADIPNASEMIALSAARLKGGDKVVSDRSIDVTLLTPEYDLTDYYRTWSQLREQVYDNCA